MNKLIIYLFLCISLSGCGIFTKKPPDAIITEKVVHIDSRVLELCKDLISIPKDSIITNETILSVLVNNIEIYRDCRSKQEAAVNLIKQFSNYKDIK